jgi:plastocyanin
VIAKVALTGVVAAAFFAGGPAAAIAPPARLQVVASEYNLALSRHTIKAGRAVIELANFGEDPHDLRLKRIGGTKTYVVRVTQSEDAATISTSLRPGTFRLWCSLANHRALGMEAKLVVRR